MNSKAISLDLAVENMDQAVHAAQYFIAASHAYREKYPNDPMDGEPWLGLLVSNALGEAVVNLKEAEAATRANSSVPTSIPVMRVGRN